MHSPSPINLAALPAQAFFNSAHARTSLARERFFDEGQRPTGLVSETVIQSWSRCHSARHSPAKAVAFEPVTRSHIHATRERNAALLAAAQDQLKPLEDTLGVAARVLLTDARGVIVHASGGPWGTDDQLLRLASRVGVNLSEHLVGTNAPALVARTGQACTVMGPEHYFDGLHRLHCAASPIHGHQGQLVGVLDLTVETRPFAFDAAALVGVVAALIENRLLQQGSAEQRVLQFQICPTLLGTPLQALAGLDSQGRLAWCNATAQKLLGLQTGAGAGAWGQRADEVLGLPVSQLVPRRNGEPFAVRLPNGLGVWMRVQDAPQAGTTGARRLQAQAPQEAGLAHRPAASPEADAVAGPASVAPAAAVGPDAATAAATLDHLARDAIQRTLAQCGGNVSAAARQLGVSRGLLYRRLGGALRDKPA